jgi:hypothetical protein
MNKNIDHFSFFYLGISPSNPENKINKNKNKEG